MTLPDTIQEDLLSIAGVASAEIEGSAGMPGGVKVRLEPGADPAIVGEQVQAVLELHGLQSRVEGAAPRSTPPPPPGAPTLRFPAAASEDGAPHATPMATAADAGGPGTETDAIEEFPVELADVADVPQDEGSPATEAPAESPDSIVGAGDAGAGSVESDGEATAQAARHPGMGTLASVSVEEGRHGLSVTAVAEDGRQAGRRARGTASGIDDAVTAAVAALVDDRSAAPRLVAVEDRTIAGTSIVLVVVEIEGGGRRAGAAVVEGGRPFAVGAAVWAALTA